MTEQPSLFERLKQSRIVQVLVVYLAASWGILQLVETLMSMLGLPGWLGPVTVVLLVVGLLVVIATAWVQSLPSTTKAEEAGERPTDWQVDAAGVIESLKSGRLPHLTWGRAIVGGVVAISLAIGAAGAYVLVTGSGGLIGPTAAGAESAPTAVAVLPFQTRGADLEVYGEGMVDLLTANLEGLGGLRTINSGTVVARWRAQVGETLVAELDDALRVAGSLNARYAVRGSVVDVGGQVRLTAEIHDVADGSRVDGAQVEGSSDEMFVLLDALTVQLATIFVGADPSGDTRALAIDTRSLDALEAYLRGAALYRQMAFTDAVDAFRSAAVEDPDFAMAWLGLSESWGWIDPGAEEGMGAGRRAAALADRLPARERIIMRAGAGMTAGNNASFQELRDYLARHPDDAQAWNELAEIAGHVPQLGLSPPGEFRSALERVVELQPTFSPYYLHLAGLAIVEGREDELHQLIEQMTLANPEDPVLDTWLPAWDFMRGTPQEMAAAEDFFRGVTGVRGNTIGLVTFGSDMSVRNVLAVRDFVRSLAESSFPYYVSAAELAAGLDPGQWSGKGLDQNAPNFLQWALLTGESEAVLAELAAGMDDAPHPRVAVSAAVLAAWVGDEALQASALAALPDTGWSGQYGLYGGAVDRDQTRRTAEAISFLRRGDPAAAAPVLEEIVGTSRYDVLAVFLLGQAYADGENWTEAIRYWETLLYTHYRPTVRLGLGRAHEALGDTEAALEGYRGFLKMWEEADPSLAALVEAREAVARLGG
jgi:TolB-like protein/tetratricopeptide (TPR) repeat protein